MNSITFSTHHTQRWRLAPPLPPLPQPVIWKSTPWNTACHMAHILACLLVCQHSACHMACPHLCQIVPYVIVVGIIFLMPLYMTYGSHLAYFKNLIIFQKSNLHSWMRPRNIIFWTKAFILTVNTHNIASYNFVQIIMSFSEIWTPIHWNTELHLKFIQHFVSNNIPMKIKKCKKENMVSSCHCCFSYKKNILILSVNKTCWLYIGH